MIKNAKYVEGQVFKGRGLWSNIHIHIEAVVNEDEKTFELWAFDGKSYKVKISDVIDVIFQAYKEAGKDEK